MVLTKKIKNHFQQIVLDNWEYYTKNENPLMYTLYFTQITSLHV